MTESELAQEFVNYLQPDFDLYFEVQLFGSRSPIIDIVAVKEHIYSAIEVKNTLSLSVIQQAYHNLGWFHYSYIAVPQYYNNRIKRNKSKVFAWKICADYGIGILLCDITVDSKGKIWNKETYEYLKPKFNRKVNTKHLYLGKHNKHSVPGSKHDRITAWRQMILDIADYVKKKPGIPIKEIFDNKMVSYQTLSTFRNCLYRYCARGIIKEFKIEKGKLYLNES